MEIKIKFYTEPNKGNQTKMPPEYTATFRVKSFEDGYMAYVSCAYKLSSNSDRWFTFDGNSLWALGKLPLEKLINKINSYQYIQQIKKDFSA